MPEVQIDSHLPDHKLAGCTGPLSSPMGMPGYFVFI